MALIAIIPPGMTEITINGLHQWDYGQTLEIHSADLPTMVEVHFACAGMKEAVVHSCNAVEGVAEVPIPDRCLEQTAPIITWVYAIGETSGTTIKTLTLTIAPRARPTIPVGEVPTAVADKYTEAVVAMNDAVAKVGDGRIIAAKAVFAETAMNDRDGNKLATAKELTDGSLVVKKASHDKSGRPFEQYLCSNIYGYVYVPEYAEDAPCVIKGGVVSLKLTAYNDNSFTTVAATVHLMIDLAYDYGQGVYSQAFYLPVYNLKDYTYTQHLYRLYFEFFTERDAVDPITSHMGYHVYIESVTSDGSSYRYRLHDKNVKLHCKYLTIYSDEIGG